MESWCGLASHPKEPKALLPCRDPPPTSRSHSSLLLRHGEGNRCLEGVSGWATLLVCDRDHLLVVKDLNLAGN